MKEVSRISFAEMVDMGGFPVRQPLPTAKIDQVDPFLLLHHHRGKVPAGSDHKTKGVGPHPHRGFSPVTFVYEGEVHHRDSRGNSQVVSEGGVQWMNAGMGIVHSERPSKHFAEQGGYQEIIQLWVNTPQANKMDQPYYLAVDKKAQPLIQPVSGEGDLRLVAGSVEQENGPVTTSLPMIAIMGVISEKTSYDLKIPEGYNSLIYVLSGTISMKGHGLIEHHNLAILSKNGNSVAFETTKETRLLLVSAPPLNEPVVNHGPFVMNTTTEIMEAMRDYQMGKMGILIEEFE
jgi:redox-sensitive bicupin YhaK (pirin superfamily)